MKSNVIQLANEKVTIESDWMVCESVVVLNSHAFLHPMPVSSFIADSLATTFNGRFTIAILIFHISISVSVDTSPIYLACATLWNNEYGIHFNRHSIMKQFHRREPFTSDGLFEIHMKIPFYSISFGFMFENDFSLHLEFALNSTWVVSVCIV